MDQVNYTLQNIPNGSAGTRETLRIMSRLVKQYKKDKAIRELALSLTSKLPQKSWLREVQAIHYFVKTHIRYTKDIRGVETIQTPVQTLRIGAGDCDDKSTLVASLLEAIGHPTRFAAIGFMPNTFCHVLPETKIGGQWVTVECTEPVKVGWKPKGLKSVMRQHN